MNHLWSPWRMSYILENINDEGCVFCHVLEDVDGLENLIVYRGQSTYIILNRYPYTSGHLMVVPLLHCDSLEGLPTEARSEMMELISCCVKVLSSEYKAHGFNVGANLGGAAGAGIPRHLHFHIVPRWLGDVNALTVFADVRVIPEHLEETHKKLKSYFNKLNLSTTN